MYDIDFEVYVCMCKCRKYLVIFYVSLGNKNNVSVKNNVSTFQQRKNVYCSLY